MLFELAYPALCAAAILRRFTRQPRPVAPLFTFRAVRSRMRRRELALLTAAHPRLGAFLALRRFEQATPERPSATVAARFNNGLAERRLGPEQGRRVLLVHGWNAGSAMMLPLARALADQGLRVIVPDLPGEGANPRRVLGFAAKARRLAAYYRNEGIEVILGHSAGALIAALAVEAGLRPARMVTICAPFSMATLLRAYLLRIGAPDALHQATLDLYRKREKRAAADIGPSRYARFGSDLLIVHARRDWQVRLAEADAIATVNPAAKRITLDNCNHHSILNDQRLFCGVTGFLERSACGGKAPC